MDRLNITYEKMMLQNAYILFSRLGFVVTRLKVDPVLPDHGAWQGQKMLDEHPCPLRGKGPLDPSDGVRLSL